MTTDYPRMPIPASLLTCLLVGFMQVSLTCELWPAEPSVEELFLDAPKVLQAQAGPAVAHAKRSRVVRMNPRLLEAGRHSLQEPGTRWKANLFPDTEPVVSVVQTEVKGDNHFVSIGQVGGVPGSQAILAVVDGVVVGSLTIPGQGVFQLEYAGPGLHRVNEVDPTRRPRCGLELRNRLGLDAPIPAADGAEPEDEAAEPDEDPIPGPRPIRPMGPDGPEPDPVVVDFLVIYTAKALAGAGGEAGMQALIDFFIAEANTAYANSQINLRWNIVYQGLTRYTDSGQLGTDWNWLNTASEVASMRNAYAADLVMMIVELEEEGWAGMAGNSVTAFVRPWIGAGIYLVVHEVGHLFGAGHDRLTCNEYGSGNCGAKYGYSYGHRFVAENATYRTIMSYEPGVYIPYFSNPAVPFLEVPTGVAEGATNAADNARTINVEAPAVANQRRATNRFELSASACGVSETNGQVTVEVLRLGDTNTTASVQIKTVNATAVGGQDFEAFQGILTFGPGETNQAASVTILEDDQAEGPEQFLVTLSSPSRGSALNPRSSATVTLQDDEPGLMFSTTNVLVAESAPRAEVLVRRTGKTDQQASVRYAVAGGTATEGIDFDPVSGVLEFATGETEKVISFVLRDDRLAEPDETCLLALSEPRGAALASPATTMVRILDDERPGSVDLSFNRGLPPNERVYALAVQPDGRILCGGWFTGVGGSPRTALVRYLPEGTVDPEFSPVVFRNAQRPDAQVNPASVWRITVQGDGKILVAGIFASVNGHSRNHIARLNLDGTLDETFAPTPGPDTTLYDVLQQPDGKILIAGAFRSVSGWASGLIARLNPDGSVDESFQAIPRPQSSYILSMVLQPDGKIIVGGWLTGFGSVARNHLMRLGTDGQPDALFRPRTPNGQIWRLFDYPDGSLLVAGVFTSPKKKIYRLKPDGALDTVFNAMPALDGAIHDLALQPDGSIIVAGEFLSTSTQNRSHVARLRPNGALDTTFDAGMGPNDLVWAVAMQPDGWVVVGGMFTAVNGASRPYLARLRSDGTRPTFAVPAWLSNGEMALKLFGNAGSTYLVESSSDLLDWMPVWTNAFTGTFWQWTEPGAASGQRFYRAVAP